MKKEKGPLLLLNLDKPGSPPAGEPSAIPPGSSGANTTPPPQTPAFTTIQRRPWLLSDLLRILLIILSIVVAAGLILVVMPQPTLDRIAKDLQARHATVQQEVVSLLYLGDEIKDNEFHIRGAVRNITTAPVEKLDAAVRLFSHDGSLLETTVVRMNKESIAPDEVAQFELVYPNYKMEFSKYSVEFKLRDGGIVAYKDMRTGR